jgi:hypothetical protein
MNGVGAEIVGVSVHTTAPQTPPLLHRLRMGVDGWKIV